MALSIEDISNLELLIRVPLFYTRISGGCRNVLYQLFMTNFKKQTLSVFPSREEFYKMGSETVASNGASTKRWSHLQKILDRSGPFCHPQFEPSPDNLAFIQETCKILVIGAGGLGCELLKNLALMGFKLIHVIDMDTIELSNLNRQFLFRVKDIGLSKAKVAAKFISDRIPGCNVVPHFCKIQDFDESFYSNFHIIVCGLDSVVARRWINGMLMSLLQYNENGELDESTVIPLIDGGTEGFKGNARVIMPGITACIDCTLDLFPPQINYPLCTIANTPRLPEHCIEYVKVIQWPKENPWGVALDGDDPNHLNWIYEKASERANQFSIQGMSYRLVQGVVKNIIPAVASTNAVIAAACATEVFKLATYCCLPLNNYMMFNNVSGIYTYTYEAEKKSDCLSCSQISKTLMLENPKKTKLQDLIRILCEKAEYQMKNPGLTAVINGKNRTLYLPLVESIEKVTRANLTKTLSDLGLQEGSEIMVADVTSPNTLIFRLSFQVNDGDVEMT